jgi:hypothetical protein
MQEQATLTQKSQSLRTAQGNSDCQSFWLVFSGQIRKSQSLRTAQGNSDSLNLANFRKALADPSQSLRTAQGNSDLGVGSGVRCCAWSQSLRTAQGNSDGPGHRSEPTRTASRNPSVQLRAIRTVPSAHAPGQGGAVAIPPYSSGQFGPYRLKDGRLVEDVVSQSLRTAQGKFGPTLALRTSRASRKSQSLRTAQGNSDCGLPRLLIPGHLAGRFG